MMRLRKRVDALADCLAAMQDFAPHAVYLHPKWPELLSNYELLDQKHEDELRQRFEQESFTDCDISYTVLQRRYDDDLPALIHWQQNNCFTTEVDFYSRVPKFVLDHYFKETKSLLAPELKFRYAIKWGPPIEEGSLPSSAVITGYEIVLDIDPRWWKRLSEANEIKNRPIEVLSEGYENLGKGAKLVLARLPLSEFAEYYGKFDSELRKTELEQSGWKQKDDSLDKSLPPPDYCIEHEYFTIEHRKLSQGLSSVLDRL